eukprot:SAG11_NODE_349_length_10401_cov_22.873423_9_plen_51_part_00
MRRNNMQVYPDILRIVVVYCRGPSYVYPPGAQVERRRPAAMIEALIMNAT